LRERRLVGQLRRLRLRAERIFSYLKSYATSPHCKKIRCQMAEKKGPRDQSFAVHRCQSLLVSASSAAVCWPICVHDLSFKELEAPSLMAAIQCRSLIGQEQQLGALRNIIKCGPEICTLTPPPLHLPPEMRGHRSFPFRKRSDS
jgi:hypothetical protein